MRSSNIAFPRSELHERPNALCVFTHAQENHFDPGSVATIGCRVAGPNAVQALVPAGVRAGPGPVWQHGGASIECLPTEHAGVGHCSWLITWHGATIPVAGDIEGLSVLERVPPSLGAIFLPHWMVDHPEPLRGTLARVDSLVPGAVVVVNHHPHGAEFARCDRCLRPAQDQQCTIPGGQAAPAAPDRPHSTR